MRLPLLLAVSICSMPLAELAAAYTSYSPDPLLSPIVVSEDGVTVTQTQRNGLGSTRSIDAVGGGKHYWEVMATCGPDTYGFTVGVAGPDATGVFERNPNGYGIAGDGARKVRDSISATFSDGFLNTFPNDIFMIALDLEAGEIYFGKNGIWLGGGNPETGTNPAYSGLAGEYYAGITMAARECTPHTLVTNFGNNDFEYEVPEGFFKGFCPTGNCPKSGELEVDVALQNKNSSCERSSKKAKKITAAFFGSSEFDVTTLDPRSVSFSGMRIVGAGFSDGACRPEYLNDDEFLDATCDLDSKSLDVSFEAMSINGEELTGQTTVCLK